MFGVYHMHTILVPLEHTHVRILSVHFNNNVKNNEKLAASFPNDFPLEAFGDPGSTQISSGRVCWLKKTRSCSGFWANHRFTGCLVVECTLAPVQKRRSHEDASCHGDIRLPLLQLLLVMKRPTFLRDPILFHQTIPSHRPFPT